MSLSYKDIKSDRQWRASTGMPKVYFIELSELFEEVYESFFGESIQDRQSNPEINTVFDSYKELLFYGLYSLKSGLTYDLLGLTFGMSNSSAFSNQSIVLAILEQVLIQTNHMPKRSFSSESEFKAYLSTESKILIDVTEQRIQRSDNQEEQKKAYSGKKKRIPPKP